MTFIAVPDKTAGDVFTEAMWDTYIRDNLNAGVERPLSDSILGASAASFDIQNIPATFAHLFVVAYLRGDVAATTIGVNMRFNADTAANYDYQQLLGQAATASAAEAFAQTSAAIGTAAAGSAGANLFGAIHAVVAHYANAANNKSFSSTFATKLGTATTNMQLGMEGGHWRSNAAISRVTILPSSGNFVAGARVTLYGMGAM